jgi:hypothetical protein
MTADGGLEMFDSSMLVKSPLVCELMLTYARAANMVETIEAVLGQHCDARRGPFYAAVVYAAFACARASGGWWKALRLSASDNVALSVLSEGLRQVDTLVFAVSRVSHYVVTRA